MKMVKAIALAFLLVGVAAVPAQAAAPDPTRIYERVVNSENPEATYESLSAAQQAAFDKYVRVDKVKTVPLDEPVMALAASNCWETGHARGAYNVVGVLLWQWNTYIEWCGDGSRITYSYARAYGQTHVAFWSWRLMDFHKSINTIANPDKLTVFGQGEFKLCVFSNIGCVQYYYPWTEGRVFANGSIGAWRGTI